MLGVIVVRSFDNKSTFLYDLRKTSQGHTADPVWFRIWGHQIRVYTNLFIYIFICAVFILLSFIFTALSLVANALAVR